MLPAQRVRLIPVLSLLFVRRYKTTMHQLQSRQQPVRLVQMYIKAKLLPFDVNKLLSPPPSPQTFVSYISVHIYLLQAVTFSCSHLSNEIKHSLCTRLQDAHEAQDTNGSCGVNSKDSQYPRALTLTHIRHIGFCSRERRTNVQKRDCTVHSKHASKDVSIDLTAVKQDKTTEDDCLYFFTS